MPFLNQLKSQDSVLIERGFENIKQHLNAELKRAKQLSRQDEAKRVRSFVAGRLVAMIPRMKERYIPNVVELYEILLGSMTYSVSRYLGSGVARDPETQIRIRLLKILQKGSETGTRPNIAISILKSETFAGSRGLLKTEPEKEYLKIVDQTILKRIAKAFRAGDARQRLSLLQDLLEGVRASKGFAIEVSNQSLSSLLVGVLGRFRFSVEESIIMNEIKKTVENQAASPLVRQVRRAMVFGMLNQPVYQNLDDIYFYDSDRAIYHAAILLEHGLIPLIHLPVFASGIQDKNDLHKEQKYSEQIFSGIKRIKKENPKALLAVGGIKNFQAAMRAVENGVNVLFVSKSLSSRQIKKLKWYAEKIHPENPDILVLSCVERGKKMTRGLNRQTGGGFLALDKPEEAAVNEDEIQRLKRLQEKRPQNVFGFYWLFLNRAVEEAMKTPADFIVVDAEFSLGTQAEITAQWLE